MSVRKALTALIGDGYRIKEDGGAVEHGEPGRRVILHDGVEFHEFFFADDRKITDENAATIIASYLHNRHAERG